MLNRCLSAIIILFLAIANVTSALAQSIETKNAMILKPYFGTRSISNLEWELLQFNLNWISLTGSDSYLTLSLTGFDYKAMRFRSFIKVREKRDHADPDPFSSLPKPKREAILQSAIDAFVEL